MSDIEKTRNGIVLLQGEDMPDDVMDRVAEAVCKVLKGQPTEVLISGVNNDDYDYYDEVCE